MNPLPSAQLFPQDPSLNPLNSTPPFQTPIDELNTPVFRSASSSYEVVFIDSAIADTQALLAGMSANAEVVLLDASRDGIAQISDFLAQRSNISALHIVSHGSAGNLLLGNASLNVNTLHSYATSLQGWTKSFTTGADILLYGCDVAAGDLGTGFVQSLGFLTGADIAASNDLTGSSALGGDWELEVNTGAIAANLAFRAEAIATYQGTFAIIDAADYNALRNGVNQFLNSAQTAVNALVWANDLPLVGSQLASTTQLFQDVLTNVQTVWTNLDAIANADSDSDGIPDGVDSSVIQTQLATQLAPWLAPAGITIDETATNLQFTLNLSRLISSTLGFDLGLDAIGLSINGNVNAGLDYQLPLTFGVDLTSSEFYVDTSATNELNIGVSITTPGLNATGQLGFLQVQAQDSATDATDFTGNFRIDLRDPNSDGRLTAAELASITSAQLLTPRLEAAADINLVLTTSFGGSAVFPSLQTDFNLDWAFSLSDPNLTGGLPTVAFNNVRMNLGSFFSEFVSPIAAEVKKVLDPIQPILDVLNTRMPVLSDIEFLRGEFDANGDGKVSLVEFIGISSGNSAAVNFINAVSQFKQFIDVIPTGVGDIFIPLGSLRLNETPGTDLRGLPNLDGLGITNFDDLSTGLPGVDEATRTIVQNFRNQTNNPQLSGGLAFPILQNPTTAFGLLLGRDVSLFTFDLPTLEVDFPVDEFFPILGPLGVRLAGGFNARADFAFGYDTFGIRQFTNALTDGNPATTPDPGQLFNGLFVSDTDRPDGTFGTDVPEIRLTATINAFGAINIIVAGAGVGGGITANVNLDLRDPNNDGKVRINELASEFSARGPLGIFNPSGKLEAGLSAYVRVGLDLPFVGFVGWEESFDIARVTLLDFDLDASDLSPSPVLAQFDASLGGSGTLRLNIGRFAGDRLTGDTTDGNETFKVTRSDDGTKIFVMAFGHTQEFNASDVQRIYAEGGIGDDVIEIAENVIVPAELWGDFQDPARTEFGNDKLFAGGAAARLFGGGGNDQLTARAGDSLLVGGDGTDTLFGGTGNDTMNGGAGRDRLYGNGGNDSLDGASESDFLDAGEGDDTVNGGTGDDRIKGGAGNDSLNGNDGNDIIEAGAGNDVADGGAGNDYLLDEGTIVVGTTGGPSAPVPPSGPVVENVTITPVAGVTVQVQLGAGGGNDRFFGGTGTDVLFGQAGSDTLIGQEGSDYIDGGSDRDIITGDVATIDGSGNIALVTGVGGNDLLFGGAGNDDLYGQGGNDTVSGQAGDDALFGNEGDDLLLGGAGNDTLSAALGNDVLFGEEGQRVDLGGGAVRYESINPSLTGNDILSGEAGIDIQIGGAGNDQFLGNVDDDIALIGDNGRVTLNSSGAYLRIETTDAQFGGNDTIAGGTTANIILGGSGRDLITGGNQNDILIGDNGVVVGADGSPDANDVLSIDTAFGDRDEIRGNGGDDIIIGGAGNDDRVADVGGLFGGAGNDTILGDSGRITRNSTNQIERVESASTNGGNDTIEDTEGNSLIIAGTGNDTVTAGTGFDIIIGDNGLATFNGSGLQQARTTDAATGGNDVIDAGGSADTVFGGTGNDNISGGSDNATDILFGDNGILYGADSSANANDLESTDFNFGGSDTITGGGGNDTIIGGSGGNDTTGIGGDDLRGGTGDDLILGDNGYITRNIDNQVTDVAMLAPTIGGDDFIQGNEGDDTIYGGAGDDTIEGNEDPDLIFGGFDRDRVQGNAGSDTIYGEAGNDDIVGGSFIAGIADTTDFIYGGAGDDAIAGDNATINPATRIITPLDSNGARDFLFGDTGTVVVSSGRVTEAFNTPQPGDGNDTVYGQTGDDIVFGGNLSDSLVGGIGNDQLIGDHGRILFNAAEAVIRAETTNPAIGGNDTIQGNDDNDTVLGGFGNDAIDGGADFDILLGDNGVVVGSDGSAQANDVFSTDPDFGGSDTIAGGSGNDTILGGSGGSDTTGIGGDNLAGDTGDDVVLGDNGYITRNSNNVVEKIETTFPNRGGDDAIAGNEGNDILLGGFGNDAITGSQGNDTILGDNGVLDYTLDGNLATLDLITTTNPTLGGNDAIAGGDGRDVALGGTANDSISGNRGQDTLLGDNGRIWLTNGQNHLIETIDPDIGGSDTIQGNEDDDIMAGGFAGDFLYGNNGEDRILGDNARFDYGYAGDSLVGADNNLSTLDFFATTAPTLGGNDQIWGGLGEDTVLGGTGSDTIYGDQGPDALDELWKLVATADFNGDGQVDLLWRNAETGQTLVWLMQNGQAIAAQPLPEFRDLSWTIAATGDFNTDGKADILWHNAITGVVAVWLMDGTQLLGSVTLAPAAGSGWAIGGTGDFNHDGETDILWENQSTAQAAVWFMNDTNVTGGHIFAPSIAGWSMGGTGDFNSDTRTDILWYNDSLGTAGIWFMHGTNILDATTFGPSSFGWSIAGTGDFNGDTKTDIVWQHQTTGAVGVWTMNGINFLSAFGINPNPTVALIDALSTNSSVVATGDFNGDGQLDSIWRNHLTGATAIWLMDGDRLLNPISLAPYVAPSWNIAGTGDFNGDNNTDILWRNDSLALTYIWFMNGTQPIGAAAVEPTVLPGWAIGGTGDFDGDNKTDIVWRNENLGLSYIWFMNGAQPVSAVAITPAMPTGLTIGGTGDFNGDGKPDLIWHNASTGRTDIWLMNGSNVIGSTMLSATAGSGWNIGGTGDFDSDGKTDIVWSNPSLNITGIWLMDGTQFRTSALLQNQLLAGDILLGDHGKVYEALPRRENFFSTDTGATDGSGNDLIFGNQGDDFIMGQQGNDTLFGDTGEDDMLGGHNVVGGADGDDAMDGGADPDVMLGDNGMITRRPTGYNQWQRYPAPFNAVIRDVVRFDDRDRIGGSDFIAGGSDDDVLHGQRGDDAIWGNAGDDEMYGELGNDYMLGGRDQDTMLGDVGIITRAYNPDGTPRLNQNGSWHRDVLLTDVGSVLGSQAGNAAIAPGWFSFADLMLLSGAYDASGNKVLNPDLTWKTEVQFISLFADGNDVMLGDEGDDAMFGQRGNDIMSGGNGADYMEGNAGNDSVAGDAGDDFALGDNSNNLSPFNTDVPRVIRGLHLIEQAGTNLNLGAYGTVVTPNVSLVPTMTSGLLPTLSFAPSLQRDNSPIPPIAPLAATDGTFRLPWVSVIPDLLNHLDLVAGNDTVNGGAGRDLTVGDDYANFMPLWTGNPDVDGPLTQATRSLHQLVYDLHDLELAFSVNTSGYAVGIGNDVVSGGSDDDTVLGDDGIFFGPTAVPNVGNLFSWLSDLGVVVSHFSNGVNALLAPYAGGVSSSQPFTLVMNNDALSGDDGNDHLFADDSITIAPALSSLPYQRGSFINYSNAGLNHPGRGNFRDFNLNLGNDQMSGGNGNDVMVGGYSTQIMPLVTAPTGDRVALQQSLDLLAADVNVFVRNLFEDRRGINYNNRDRSYSLVAANDSLNGDAGSDLMVGDNVTLTLPILNGQLDLTLSLNRGNFDPGDQSHNFFHGLPHQYDTLGRNLNNILFARDLMSGGDGDDILYGLRAVDQLFGENGNDFLFGGEESDNPPAGMNDGVDGGSGINVTRNTNPSPKDLEIIAPLIQAQLANSLSPAMQRYILEIFAFKHPTTSNQFYANIS
ncbi:MAG: DUF4347 domain-containing protein [Oscillatoriales cyanobacterium C42_A2020_001]|nr:DUF4347 domain-containing protein [Leptolyngbyaceae cyanobacterium C42_A2020_001]